MKKTIFFFLILLTSPGLIYYAQGQKIITIDPTDKKQTIDGFGGSIAYYEGWVTAHPRRSMIFDYLFKDLGMSIFRTRNMYMNEGGNNPGVNDTRTIVTEGLKRSSFDIMISSWSPPGKYKSNGKPENDETMATLATDTAGNFVYGGFARWWYNSLLEYKSKGIDVKYISIQNEPNWNPDYEGCIFMPTERVVFDKVLNKQVKVASYATAFDAVYDTLAQYSSNLNVQPLMIGPEVLGIEKAYSGHPDDYTPYMDMSKCYALAHHLYTGTDKISNMSLLAETYPDIPKMQTEYSDKDWYSLAKIIHNSLVVENVSAYLVWDLIWPEGEFMDMEFPWSPGSWTYPNGFKVGTKYYMFKQFSKFIRPGYQRVESTGGTSYVMSSAYMNPEEDKLIVVLLNSTPIVDSVTIAPEGYEITSGSIYHTTETDNCSLVGEYTGQAVKLAPKSVTTLELQVKTLNVGVKVVPEQIQLKLWPNPFTHEMMLNLEEFAPDAVVGVHTLSGKVLFHRKAAEIPSGKIGADLPPGIYLLNITDKETSVTGKIVKQ